MAEEKKNRSEELESLDKKINEIINGWNQNPEEIVEFLQFSSKFSAIVLQALQPFNKEKYIKVIKQFTFFHSQEEIAVQSKLSSRCTVHYRASQTVPIQK